MNFEVIGYSENDPYCCKLYEANHPNVPNFGDITTINAEDLPDFDMFMGGFPCQPFSSAGLGKGELDIRGTLFYDIVRICESKRPKYILLENVKGLTTNRHRETFDKIKSELKRIGYGDLAYKMLNTKDYGIPQNRERLWMFAQYGGLPDTFNLEPPKVKLTKSFGDFLDQNPPQELYLSDAQIAHLKEKHHIPSFIVDKPLCFDVYNKKIKHDALCITLTMPEHNSIRAIEVPKEGREIVRKLSIAEQFRFMGFEDGELITAGQSYTQLSRRAGNGWDVNLVGILLKHIFSQL
ncbi:MAG: DNA (cytosine-5-)-methyltransferase [Prevotella sp.]|nr:DNA (cytosine-5-)-methyltransferase [Prevotella sp.]